MIVSNSSFRDILIYGFMLIVKLIVNVYTVTTLPLYYLIQNPKKKLIKAQALRARRVDPSKPEWVREGTRPYHILEECNSLSEGIDKALSLYPSDHPAMGYREIIAEEVQLDKDGNEIRIDGKVLRKYKLSEYKWLTFGQVGEKIQHVFKGFSLIGMKKYERVAIFADTCLEWMISSTGIDHVGGILVTVFSTLGDDGIVYAFNQTEVSTCVTSYELLPKLSLLADKIPTLRRVIYFEGPVNSAQTLNNITFPPGVSLFTLSQVEKAGRETTINIQYQQLDPDEVALIMYTSGTTGIPKGVLATPRLIKEAGLAMLAVVKDVIEDGPHHTYVAYLPMAHILEASVQMFLFAGGVRIGYASPFTLNESAPGLADGQVCDLKLLKPTVMTCVPLVLDRIRKEMYEKLRNRTPVSTDLFNYLSSYKVKWTNKGYDTPIVNKLLCSKVREQLGGRLEYMVVGGAPLSPELQALIKSAADVTLIQGYGATETLGAVLSMDFNDLSFGRVGAPLSGIRIKLVDWVEGGYKVTDKPNPRGEIVIGGTKVACGYFKMDQLSSEVFREEDGTRWFYTGDIGEAFPDGTFKIIDRRSDLIKMQNGEFIALGKIEAALKNCQFVDNVCVCGNSLQNFTVALIVPNHRAMLKLAHRLNLENQDLQQLCNNEQIIKTIRQALDLTGQEMKLHKKELPTFIKLVSEQWAPDNGFLTAAMKLRRKNIHKFYQGQIEQMFKDAKSNLKS